MTSYNSFRDEHLSGVLTARFAEVQQLQIQTVSPKGFTSQLICRQLWDRAQNQQEPAEKRSVQQLMRLRQQHSDGP